MSGQLEEIWKEAVDTYLRQYPDIILTELRKIRKIIIYEGGYPCWDANWTHLEHVQGTLKIHTCSVILDFQRGSLVLHFTLPTPSNNGYRKFCYVLGSVINYLIIYFAFVFPKILNFDVSFKFALP